MAFSGMGEGKEILMNVLVESPDEQLRLDSAWSLVDLKSREIKNKVYPFFI